MNDSIAEIPDGFKYCPECKQVLPLDKFRKRSKYQECEKCITKLVKRRSLEQIRADPSRYEEFKARDRENHRAVYAKKSDEILAKERERRKKYPERYREYEKRKKEKQGAKNIDSARQYMRQYMRQWRDRNWERLREKERVANMTPEAIARKRERARENRKRNPLKAVERSERRRARLVSAEGLFTEDDIHNIYHLQQGRCLYCEVDLGNAYTIDHFIPLSHNGRNSKENLALCCRSCNSSKGNRFAWRWRRWNGAYPVFYDGRLL